MDFIKLSSMSALQRLLEKNVMTMHKINEMSAFDKQVKNRGIDMLQQLLKKAVRALISAEVEIARGASTRWSKL